MWTDFRKELESVEGQEKSSRSPLVLGCDHPEYAHIVPLSVSMMQNLGSDFVF